jgi:hypothetical protein
MGKLKLTPENIYASVKDIKNWVKASSTETILGKNSTFEGYTKDFSAKLELILIDGGSGSIAPIQHMQLVYLYNSKDQELGNYLFIQEFPGKEHINYKFINLYNRVKKNSTVLNI